MALWFYDFARVQFASLSRTLSRRQRVRMDGFDADDDGDTIVLTNNGPRGLVTSDLAALEPSEDNRVVQTYRYSPSRTGAGARWRFAHGVTSGADGYTKINTSGGAGQWQMLDPDEHGVLNPRWFGATGDGVTEDTSAMQAAITYCVSSGKALKIPPGTYLCDTLTIAGRLRMDGAGIGNTRIKAKYPYSGGATPSGSAPKGVIEVYAAGTVNDVSIGHLTVDGGRSSWSYTDTVSANHRRHGIYVHPAGGASRVRIEHCRAVLTTGDGFYLAAGVFETSHYACSTDSCGGGGAGGVASGGFGFYAFGDNTLMWEGCSSENIPHLGAQFRIENGHPTILNCNGILPGVGIDAAAHRVSWGIFGNGAGGVVRAVITGCNIESFTAYGCYFFGQSYAEFTSTSIILSQPCKARAIFHGGWNTSVLPRNAAKTYVTDGTWGNPETQITDNQPLSVEGPQYLPTDESWAEAINATGTYKMPRFKATGSPAYLSWMLLATHLGVEREFAVGTEITAANSPYQMLDTDHILRINTTAGPVTVIPPGGGAIVHGRVFHLVAVSTDTNAVTVDPQGAETINGAATYSFATGGISRCTLYGDWAVGGGWIAV